MASLAEDNRGRFQLGTDEATRSIRDFMDDFAQRMQRIGAATQEQRDASDRITRNMESR